MSYSSSSSSRYNSALSPRNDQFCFTVQGGRPEKTTGGLGEIDTIVQEKLAARDREHEMEAMRKELEEARGQIAEAEETVESLRQELEEVRAGRERKHIKGIEVISILLEGFVRRNPQLLQKLPGGEALAGLIEQDNQERSTPLPTAPMPEATFRKKEEAGPSLTPEQARYIETLRQLEASFQQPELETVMQILGRFTEAHGTLQTVAELLNIKNIPS